jgi:troponin T
MGDYDEYSEEVLTYERYETNKYEEEEEAEEECPSPNEHVYGKTSYAYDEEDDDGRQSAGLSETEKQIWLTKKKHRQEEEEHMREYVEERARERERLETELEELRERQARRREERDEEMAKMFEMQRAQEEQRKQDDEERRAKLEADKRKKEADRKKKQAMMAGGGLGGLTGAATGGKPNFVLPQKEKDDGADKGVSVKLEPGHTKEEAQAAKDAALARYHEPFDCEEDASAIRARIKGMHEQISKAEAAKYDLEQRNKVQDYDLRELRERAKQQARQKALKKGLDPEEYANSKHPPKKAVASKYDRQIDRRSFVDRKVMYAEQLRMDGKPQIPPPKAIFHGSCRPPEQFGRPATKLEELEQLRKILEGVKYQEVAPVEGAKPPMQPVKPGPVPADDEIDTKPRAAPAPAPEPAAAPAPPAEEPAAEEEEE